LIPHLTRCTSTGNAGLGKETILQLAKHNPERIFLGARSKAKAEDAIESVKSSGSDDVEIVWIPLDLMSGKSIKNAAERVNAQSSRLDILILNAGVMIEVSGMIRAKLDFMTHFCFARRQGHHTSIENQDVETRRLSVD
jgi:NAD(P)-dependent dehydrogenase (short-subunit alcohol dehydrogenase family)